MPTDSCDIRTESDRYNTNDQNARPNVRGLIPLRQLDFEPTHSEAVYMHVQMCAVQFRFRSTLAFEHQAWTLATAERKLTAAIAHDQNARPNVRGLIPLRHLTSLQVLAAHTHATPSGEAQPPRLACHTRPPRRAATLLLLRSEEETPTILRTVDGDRTTQHRPGRGLHPQVEDASHEMDAQHRGCRVSNHLFRLSSPASRSRASRPTRPSTDTEMIADAADRSITPTMTSLRGQKEMMQRRLDDTRALPCYDAHAWRPRCGPHPPSATIKAKEGVFQEIAHSWAVSPTTSWSYSATRDETKSTDVFDPLIEILHGLCLDRVAPYTSMSAGLLFVCVYILTLVHWPSVARDLLFGS